MTKMQDPRWIVAFGTIAVFLLSDGAAADSRFAVYGAAEQEVVLDRATRLEWAKKYATNLTWKQALRRCEGLDYGGHMDWRLPTVNELRGLVNIERSSPASSFPDMPSLVFWSSSPSSDARYTNYAWIVNFGSGSVSKVLRIYVAGHARCVRGGP